MPAEDKNFSVEILCKRKKFITLDFNKFAIVIKRCEDSFTDMFHVYFSEEYREEFLDISESLKYFKHLRSYSVKITEDAFKEIRRVFSRPRETYPVQAWDLLRKNFPKQMHLYCR